jgi:hypothetical protein
MAITEFESESWPGDSPEQPGIYAVNSPILGQEVSITPVPTEEPVTVLRPVEPFENFRTRLHGLIRGGEYEHKSSEELNEIRGDIQAARDALTVRYAELARLEATLQQEVTFTNGYLIDLNKAISEKQKDQST